jgi:hypothetical protein
MSRKPDFNLKAMRRDTDQKNRVGAGWFNEDGSISIVLDSFIVLESHPQLILTLFPRTEK